jgi:hypothetical protein
MKMLRLRRRRTPASLLAAAAAVAAMLVLPGSALAAGQFTFLAPGFTQDLFGTQPSFMGGIAFAPDGDAITDDCSFGGSPLHRFDAQSTLPAFHGATTMHPRTDISSNAGCGITQAAGVLFSNTSSGVTKLNPDTGATIAGPFGPGGNALGITVDPVTQRLIYVGSDGTLYSVNQDLNSQSTFSTALQGHFVDGIFFSPDGAFLFTADRSPGEQLTILRRDGSLVQSVPATHIEPDGIAFHATAPKFVVSNNTDGTITRWDFPNDDYTQTPTQTLFASGGGRGDLTQVGNDGCLYVSQDNFTRYDDGTTDGNSSIVRICPGFAPAAGVEGPPGAANCSNGIDDDGDGLTDLADPDCQAPGGVDGRMVTNTTKDGVKYASIVDCDAATANTKSRPFYVQWSSGGTKTFRATHYDSVSCSDDPSVPGNRPAGFDSQTGTATGTLNGTSGYRLTWTASDGGTAANSDKIDLKVTKISDGSTQKSLSGTLSSGTAHSALPPA